MADSPFSLTRTDTEEAAIEAEKDLPPVVARMVVEIRSDGTKTVARGAMEDIASGEKVALRADASSPVALAKELSKTLLSAPFLASGAMAGALPELLKAQRHELKAKLGEELRQRGDQLKGRMGDKLGEGLEKISDALSRKKKP